MFSALVMKLSSWIRGRKQKLFLLISFFHHHLLLVLMSPRFSALFCVFRKNHQSYPFLNYSRTIPIELSLKVFMLSTGSNFAAMSHQQNSAHQFCHSTVSNFTSLTVRQKSWIFCFQRNDGLLSRFSYVHLCFCCWGKEGRFNFPA